MNNFILVNGIVLRKMRREKMFHNAVYRLKEVGKGLVGLIIFTIWMMVALALVIVLS